MIKIQIREQTIQLLPQRAAFWVEKKVLIIADVHLGKAATFQRAGIAIPEGSMQADLDNLTQLIKKMKPAKCIIVGDLIHSKSGLSEKVQIEWKNCLSSFDCPIELVLGNHDRSLIKNFPGEWQFMVHLDYLLIEPFCFSHIPREYSPYFVWSGHLHPQFLLKSFHDRLTLRCFSITDHQAILPAFSDFVGGSYIKQTTQNKIYLLSEKEVIPLSS